MGVTIRTPFLRIITSNDVVTDDGPGDACAFSGTGGPRVDVQERVSVPRLGVQPGPLPGTGKIRQLG